MFTQPSFQREHHVPACVPNPLHLRNACRSVGVSTVSIDPRKTQSVKQGYQLLSATCLISHIFNNQPSL